MVITKLEILNKSVPFGVSIPIPITYQLADVREPDKRNASFSKTISIFGTNEINKMFENIFDVNTKTQNFNKNLKTDCKYYVNEIETFRGSLQLIKINLRTDKSIVYECSVVGEGGSIFFDIGDKLITGNPDSADDLDFSAYDHTYDRSTQVSTRSNAGTGLDVVYPFIDKGSNGGSDTIWNVEDFLPCFHASEYITKILTKAGYTINSSFLTSAEFKTLIVYPNLSEVKLDSGQLNDSQFYIGDLGSGTTSLGILGGAKHVYYLSETATAPFFDLGSQYSAPIVTINNPGKYNLVSIQNLSVSWTHTNPVVARARFNGLSLRAGIEASYDAGVSWSLVAQVDTLWKNQGINRTNLDSDFTIPVTTGEIVLSAGTLLRHTIELSSPFPTVAPYIIWEDNVGNSISTGTGTFDIGWNGVQGVGLYGTQFYGLLTNKSIVDGQTMICNNALPINVKQKDLFKSILQHFNLYIQPNKYNPKELLIEDYETFYNDDIINYENRTDKNIDESINPNLLEAKRYIYRYKQDNDYYNKEYQTKYSEPFGTETLVVENDFTKADKVSEVIFSPTPNVANYDLGIAHPRIFTIESNVKKTIVPNIRLLYCTGVKTSSYPITYRDLYNSDLLSTDYLYAGHTDDPFNPTVDLNFGIPKEVYYTYVNAYFTTNNCHNRFHAPYLNNITNRDSKFVIKNIWLTPRDIYNFSFRHRWFIDDAYYIVNKIINYDPTQERSIQCELIKLLESDVFTPSSFRLTDSTDIKTGNGVSTAKLNSALNVGTNVQNRGTNCIAIGNNIFIPEGCSNLTVIGNDVVVANGVSNSSVINTDNYTLTQSNYSVTNSISIDSYFLDGDHTTVDATPDEITFNTPSGLFDMQGEDVVYRLEIRILAVDTATGDCKEWKGAKIIKNISGTTSTNNIETVTSVFSDASMAACTANLYDDATPQSIECGIVGIAATTIEWKCYVNFLKIQI